MVVMKEAKGAVMKEAVVMLEVYIYSDGMIPFPNKITNKHRDGLTYI